MEMTDIGMTEGITVREGRGRLSASRAARKAAVTAANSPPPANRPESWAAVRGRGERASCGRRPTCGHFAFVLAYIGSTVFVHSRAARPSCFSIFGLRIHAIGRVLFSWACTASPRQPLTLPFRGAGVQYHPERRPSRHAVVERFSWGVVARKGRSPFPKDPADFLREGVRVPSRGSSPTGACAGAAPWFACRRRWQPATDDSEASGGSIAQLLPPAPFPTGLAEHGLHWRTAFIHLPLTRCPPYHDEPTSLH